MQVFWHSFVRYFTFDSVLIHMSSLRVAQHTVAVWQWRRIQVYASINFMTRGRYETKILLAYIDIVDEVRLIFPVFNINLIIDL